MQATDYEIRIIRSRRRTLGLEITPSGEIVARAPMRMSEKEINAFVTEKHKWIEKHLTRLQKAREAVPERKLSREELDALYKKAREYIPERAQYYARLLGADYGRITVRCQKTKWGSCSSKGNLNFNCLLMLTPPEVIDSVVAHEICHLRHMNHSGEFYALLRQIFPDYDKCSKWLKINGGAILRSVHG